MGTGSPALDAAGMVRQESLEGYVRFLSILRGSVRLSAWDRPYGLAEEVSTTATRTLTATPPS